tara:strand:- start:403 stop:681 length:279 start_codon:yes stop_codon:yes gene_type:complete
MRASRAGELVVNIPVEVVVSELTDAASSASSSPTVESISAWERLPTRVRFFFVGGPEADAEAEADDDTVEIMLSRGSMWVDVRSMRVERRCV